MSRMLTGGEGRLEAGRRGCFSVGVAGGAEDLKNEAKPLLPYTPRLPHHQAHGRTGQKDKTNSGDQNETAPGCLDTGYCNRTPLPGLPWHHMHLPMAAPAWRPPLEGQGQATLSSWGALLAPPNCTHPLPGPGANAAPAYSQDLQQDQYLQGVNVPELCCYPSPAAPSHPWLGIQMCISASSPR